MSNLRISDLTNAFPDSLQNGDLIPIARGGETRKLIGINLKSSILGTIPTDLTNLTTKVSNLLANDSSTINLTFLNSSYSLSANVISGSIDTVHLTNSGVTTDKIANLNVTPGKLSTGAPSWNSSGDATIQRALIVNRGDLNQEGGEIRLARAIDNSVAWQIDAFGTSNTPDFRILDGPTQTVRLFIEGDNGNVGVGTVSPLTRFTVTSDNPVGNGPFLTLQNTSNSSTDAYGPSIVFRTGRVGEMPIITGVRQNDSRFYIAQLSSPFTEFFTVNSSGNVGIGTTTPNEILDVDGTLHLRAGTAQYQSSVVDLASRTQSYISFAPAGSNSDWAYLRQIGSSEQYHLALDFHDDSDDARFSIRSVQSTLTPDNIVTRFTINSTGNVGIGTASPTERLTVSGNINATGNISSSGNINATGNISSSGNINATGNISSSGNINATGTISTTNTVTASAFKSSTGKFANTENNDYVFVDPSDDGIKLVTNDIERVRVTSLGRVGIGTSTPTYKLTLSGTSTVVGLDNTAIVAAKNVAGTYENVFWPRWSDNVTYLNYGSGGLHIRNSASASVLFAQDGGNIGIGTTNPSQAKLVVNGNIFATDGTNGSSINSAEGSLEVWRSDSSPFIDFKTSLAEDFDCRIQQASNGLSFQTGGHGVATERMRITSAGNVGIGTTVPNEKLTVVGSISAYSVDPSPLTLDRPSVLSVSCAFKNNSGITYAGRPSNTNGNDIFSIGTSNNLLSNPSFFINSAGNTGINNTSPFARLTIGGGLGIGDGIGISATHGARRSIQINTDNLYGGTFDNHSGYLLYSTMPSGGWGSQTLSIAKAVGWGVYDTATPVIRILGLAGNTGGLVGINKADPTETLDVVGTMKVSGTATFNNGAIINNASPALFFQDTNNRSGAIYTDGGVMYILRGTGNNAILTTPLTNGHWPLAVSLENGDNVVGGNLYIQNGINILRNTAGTFRYIAHETANSDRSVATARFHVGIDNVAETGSNAGSNYFIHRYSDTGVYLGRPLSISRSTGNVFLENNLTVNNAGNPLLFTSNWSGFTNNSVNHAEISNDTGAYKTLMIVGNRSNDAAVRRVSVWDRLEVNGNLAVTGSTTSINTAKAWANFNGSTLVISGSFNVSSIGRPSTGSYAVNLITAFLNANHATIASCSSAAGYNDVNAQTSTASSAALGVATTGIIGSTQAAVNALDISVVAFN